MQVISCSFFFKLLPKLHDFINSDDCIGKITSKSIRLCLVFIYLKEDLKLMRKGNFSNTLPPSLLIKIGLRFFFRSIKKKFNHVFEDSASFWLFLSSFGWSFPSRTEPENLVLQNYWKIIFTYVLAHYSSLGTINPIWSLIRF